MSNHKGLFVVIEGMDGAGKSTATQYLVDTLRELKIDTVGTYEVGGTPIGKQLRGLCFRSRQEDDEVVDPVARILMLYAARIQHLRNVVLPSKEAGKVVVSDRFVQSTRVYQGEIDGLNPLLDKLDAVEELSLTAQMPDLLIYLDLTNKAGIAHERVKARAKADNDVYKGTSEQAQKVKYAYDRLIYPLMKEYPDRVIRIDATDDLPGMKLSMSYVAGRIAELVTRPADYKKAPAKKATAKPAIKTRKKAA